MSLLQVINKAAGDSKYQNARKHLAKGIEDHGKNLNLKCDHRVLMFLPQVMHEAGNGQWLKELWGPTAAQKRYEGRKDLGNTEPGDGIKYRGRGWIQCTGRANYRECTKWLREIKTKAIDFEVFPGHLAEPEWAAWSAFWYWSQRVPMRYVDEGDIDRVTRSINGGYNGLQDRKDKFTACGLAMLGFPTIANFQQSHGLVSDGISGPLTRKAIFDAVKG